MQMSLADRVTSVVLAMLGFAMVVGGYTMDRLEIRHIHPASIPGLTPMILGVFMMICAFILWRSSSPDTADEDVVFAGGSWARLGITAGICIFYALGLVGTLPFIWATVAFLFSFMLVFSWDDDAPNNIKIKKLAIAAILSLVVAFAVSYLFQEVFLVRLP